MNPRDGYSIRYYYFTCEHPMGLEHDDCYEHHACELPSCLTSMTAAVSAPDTMRHFRQPAGAGNHQLRYFWSVRLCGRSPRRCFFSRNRFIVQTGAETWTEPQTTPDRVEAAIFLTETVPPSSLSCLHFLELVFPRLDPSYLASDEPVYLTGFRLSNTSKIS